MDRLFPNSGWMAIRGSTFVVNGLDKNTRDPFLDDLYPDFLQGAGQPEERKTAG